MATPLLDQMVDLLRASALLETLPVEELRELATRVHRSRHEAGELLFRKGDEGTGMMVVLSGRVKITSVGSSGSEVILNIMEPGQVFGEMSLVDGEPRSADAVAASATEIVTLLRRDFLPMLGRNPEAALGMMTVLSGRIRRVTQFVEDAIFLDVPTRLLNRLRFLAEQYGKPNPDTGGVRVDHGFTQQDLADSVGVTRVSINRQLSSWEERGLISKGRGWIEVPSFDALEDYVLD